MADFQTVGVTSAFAASRSNQHRFHRHHHHHQRHPSQDQSPSAAAAAASSSSPGARLEDSGRTSPSPSALAFLSQSSKKPFPVSGADFRVAETTSGGRGSEDPSSHLRSEWVTLSKAMLMMLVEKICQLSFENEPPAPPPAAAAAPPGTGSGRRDAPPEVPSGVPRSKDDDDSGMPDRCRTSHVDKETTPSLPPSAICDPSSGGVTSAEESEVDSQLPSLVPSPSFPSSDSLRGRPRTTPRPSPECSPDGVGIEPSGEGGLDGPATSLFGDDSTRPEPDAADASERLSSFARKTQLVSNSNLKRNSKHSRQKLLLLMAGKAGKSGRPGFGGGGGGGGGGGDGKRDSAGDDTFRKLKTRSLRQRNSDRNVQSWIACNKSLVYSMIDSALGTPDPQQTTRAANRSKFGSVEESAAGNGADDDDGGGVAEVSASSAEGGKTQKQPVAQDEPVCRLRRPAPSGEAPLLGALLNHDDGGDDGAKTPCFRFGRWPTLRPDAACRNAAAARGQGATYSPSSTSGGLSTQNAPRLYEQSPTDDGLLLLRRVAAGAGGDRCGVGGSSVETQGGSRSVADTVGQTRSPGSDDGDGDSVSVDRGRGGAGLPAAPRRRRFGSENGTRRRPQGTRAAGDVDPTAPRKPGPLWIALDKSEVCSLVDSLVSRMMTTTNGDVGGHTSARCRGDALPSNAAVCRDNADGGNHGNDDVPVDFSRARSAAVCGDHHGNDGAERGDHGNGRQRKYSIQCLLFEDREKSEDLGSECPSKETDNSMTSRRRDGSEGSKFNLKWKTNMLLRLHSQSQEDCDNA